MKKKFSAWLATTYKLKVQDMSETNVPWFWRNFTNAQAFAVRGRDVYVRKLAHCTEPRLSAVLVHELRHILRQRKLRWLVFLVRYGLQREFRAMEEVNAFARTMEFNWMQDRISDPDYYARIIRDNYYVGDTQYKRARTKLREKYEQIKSGELHVVRDLWAAFEG